MIIIKYRSVNDWSMVLTVHLLRDLQLLKFSSTKMRIRITDLITGERCLDICKYDLISLECK